MPILHHKGRLPPPRLWRGLPGTSRNRRAAAPTGSKAASKPEAKRNLPHTYQRCLEHAHGQSKLASWDCSPTLGNELAMGRDAIRQSCDYCSHESPSSKKSAEIVEQSLENPAKSLEEKIPHAIRRRRVCQKLPANEIGVQKINVRSSLVFG